MLWIRIIIVPRRLWSIREGCVDAILPNLGVFKAADLKQRGKMVTNQSDMWAVVIVIPDASETARPRAFYFNSALYYQYLVLLAKATRFEVSRL